MVVKLSRTTYSKTVRELCYTLFFLSFLHACMCECESLNILQISAALKKIYHKWIKMLHLSHNPSLENLFIFFKMDQFSLKKKVPVRVMISYRWEEKYKISSHNHFSLGNEVNLFYFLIDSSIIISLNLFSEYKPQQN